MSEPTRSPASASRRRLAWRVGLGTVVVGAATVAVFGLAPAGADPPPASTPGASAGNDHPWTGPPWAGRWGGPWGGPWGAPFDIRDALHGEVVIAKDGGGTQTMLIQKGAVTEVNATSISVKSDDGFTKTYALNGKTRVNGGRDEIGSVGKDERVVVTAVQTGGSLTAQNLVDLTDLGYK